VIDKLMQEPPHGRNAGRENEAVRVKDDDVSRTRSVDLDASKVDFVRTDGWSLAIAGAAHDGGLVAHRGPLQEGEYVDFFVLREQVEEALGFTYADVSAAYKNGRPSAAQLQLRVQLDARVLELSRAGGNMEQFAKAVGVSPSVIDRALVRARLGNPEPTVKHGVVKHDRVCFKCEAPARRRKRRFSDSPPEWTGTIDLCDDHYAAGFEERPGNPAYWEFRDDRRPIRA
jgi:hypothetical protein